VTALSLATRLKHALRNKPLLIGGLILLTVTLTALLAPWIAPYPPAKLAITQRLLPPSFSHFFGTDEFGRDVFSRAIYAGRISLTVSTGVVALASALGIFLGILAGYFRCLDAPISRLLDAMMSFPDILLAIALVAALGPSLANVILALGVTYAPRLGRVVRGSTLLLRELPYVEAARTLGLPLWQILLRHILLNLVSPILVQASFIFASAMLAEAALSFLGAGVSTDMPTWGTMLAMGREYMNKSPWLMYFPGLAIVLTALSLQILGDGLRDLVDPRLGREV
jgi:peptide/nickel transport system permease protein